jgi:hypothetical protein
MPEPNPASQTYIRPQHFEALRHDLELAANCPPGSRTVTQAILELLPSIRVCRERGHTWEALAKAFQKHLPNLTTATLRKTAWELDPTLDGSAPKNAVPAVAVAEVSQNGDATAPSIRSAPAAKALAEVSGNDKKAETTSGQPKTTNRSGPASTRTQKSHAKKR